MRKLAVAATAFSAAVFLANYIQWARWLLIPAVILAFAGAFMARRERWMRPAVIAAAFFALGLLNYAVQYELTAGRAKELEGTTGEVTLRLTSYPTDYGDYCRAEGVLTGEGMPGLKAIFYDNSASIRGARPGQTVRCTGKISAADTLFGERYDSYNAKDIYLKISAKGAVKTEGTFDARAIPAYLNHALGERIREIFPEDTAPFMSSLLMGDRTAFYDDDALSLSFSRAGLSHVVAVSGMHIAFLISLLRLLLGASRRSSAICIALLWLFTLVTGAGPSTVRAAVMQTMLLSAPLVYRESDGATSLSAALALILLKNPLAAKSISLQLSFAAMAGILCFSGKIYRGMKDRLSALPVKAVRAYIAGTTASSLAVAVFTAPLTAIHFGYIPVLSMLANLLALWAVSLCFCMGWITCALSLIPLAGEAAAWACAWVARYIFLCARAVSAIPFAVVYTRTEGAWLWLAGVYAAFGLFRSFRLPKLVKAAAPAALSALSLALLLTAAKLDYERGEPTISAVDVGQGQSIAAFCGDATVVIDCGMSSGFDAGERMGEYLISCGREKIDLLMLTHLHEDHANGLPMLMEMMEVDTLILPEKAEDEDGLREKIMRCAAEKGTRVEQISDDCSAQCGDIALAIYTFPELEEENEYCLMTQLSIGDFDALITADSSAATERRLIESHRLRDTELLIVGHHGSKYSSAEDFLKAVGAEHAVISVGYNTYGHPAEETLERLARCGYNVYRTDIDGTVELRITDGEEHG